MPVLSNLNWGAIAVFVAAIFGVLTVMLEYLQLIHRSKGFSWKILSIAPLFKVASGFQEQLEIRLNHIVVSDVYLLIVKFLNSGIASIKQDDYARPVKLSFKKGHIINAEVVETDPDDLGEVIETQDETSVTFKKILLNSKDNFVIKILLTGFDGSAEDVNVEGRIEGVKKIEISRKRTVQREPSVYMVPLPEVGYTFLQVMFALICVLIALSVLLYFFTYFPR